MTLDVDAMVVRGRWVRHVPAGGDPLYRPAVPGDGRWQQGSVVEGFYLADEPGTAWAEWYRALAELGVAPMRQMPRELWHYVVELPHLADLSGADQLARVGLDPPVPTRRQWPAYQAVGEALWREGWAGVLSTSAARPAEGRVLCVFRADAEVPGVTPSPPPEGHHEPPAPPQGLHT